MHVGILQIEIAIGDANSLKDKRRSVLSIKDRISNGFNVSVAEVAALDEHRRAVLGVAMVGNDKAYIEGAMSKIVDLVKMTGSVSLTDFQVEFV